ncbi:ATP-binding protein [Achromobacter xylosoxidans]
MIPPAIINMPPSLTLWTAFPFCEHLQRLGSASEYIFDFKKTNTVEAFGMLVVSSEIVKFIAKHSDSKITYRNYEHMTYAGHMGFFKSCGINFGKMPGEANGSRNYIPLTYFNTSEMEARAASAGDDIGDEVERQSQRLAETLLGICEGDVYETLSYSIREIMRNVLEHAQVDSFGFCAQYWPQKGRAEVSIVDRGIGLKKSLEYNPHIDASDDKRAINYALMPAISGKAFKGARPAKRGPWTNSGFGLYMTNRICRKGGNFFISSGDTGVLLTPGRDGRRYIKTCLDGTAVRLVIHTKNADELRSSLARFRAEGYEIQKRYREIVDIDPSSASLMLAQDFDMSLMEKILSKIRVKKP